MNMLELVKSRRSIRVYQDKEVPKQALEEIVDCARFAATARNVQPWEFVAITSAEMLKKIAGVTDHGKFLSEAKACIAVFCSDTKYYLEDGCAATENILISAAMLGIGSCWIAGDKKPYCVEVGRLLNVPQEYKLVSLVALGYPQDENSFKLTDKRPLKELLHWERF